MNFGKIENNFNTNNFFITKHKEKKNLEGKKTQDLKRVAGKESKGNLIFKERIKSLLIENHSKNCVSSVNVLLCFSRGIFNFQKVIFSLYSLLKSIREVKNLEQYIPFAGSNTKIQTQKITVNPRIRLIKEIIKKHQSQIKTISNKILRKKLDKLLNLRIVDQSNITFVFYILYLTTRKPGRSQHVLNNYRGGPSTVMRIQIERPSDKKDNKFIFKNYACLKAEKAPSAPILRNAYLFFRNELDHNVYFAWLTAYQAIKLLKKKF
ncbi:hypothetical protein BpHYR1_038907 [Brachionus plicatilis]|uniref:Uncharacterized protein n=1 Tax=Brachionus plicatilis TaxID=10195 RepID=A0A3M7S0I5_BRAPC|nr:hypothetical protein BpHYR1_038907 [Brachionus plicatilis]